MYFHERHVEIVDASKLNLFTNISEIVLFVAFGVKNTVDIVFGISDID